MGHIVLQKGKEKNWILFIKGRIKKNKNFLACVTGSTGSGKSWSSLKIAEDLDPNFNIDRVVFDGISLMELINSGTLNKGSVIVFEEAGIEMSNKSWQSVINKMLNFLIQTFRHKQIILLLNSPFMDFIDASTRKLFHAEFKTVGIDYKQKQVISNPQHIQYNGRMQKFYYKHLRVITKEYGIIPVMSWRIDKPSKELLKQYEIKKTKFT